MTEKKPKLKRDWAGRLVRLRRDVTTKGGTIFPEGMVMKVYRNHSGLTLETVTRCESCEVGHRHIVIGVDEWEVELLPEDYSDPAIKKVTGYRVKRLCGHAEVVIPADVVKAHGLTRTPCEECLPGWLSDEEHLNELTAEG